MGRSRIDTYEGRPLANPNEDIFDQGLAFDLETLFDRRRMLKVFGVSGLAVALPSSGADRPPTVPLQARRGRLPMERSPGTIARRSPRRLKAHTRQTVPTARMSSARAGSFERTSVPASGSSRVSPRGFLSRSGLTIENTSDGCAPLAGGAVYLWHCSREGNYSLYTVTDQNYLRGVQEADGDGVVTFTSIFPGC